MSGLSRLKKVCKYASVVMDVATVVLALLTIAMAAIGIWSAFDASLSAQIFNDLLHLGTDADGLTKTAACIQIVLILGLGALTVFILGRIMRSIHTEHSPFTELNASRMKLMSVSYLISSFLLMVLGIMKGSNVLEIVFLFLGMLLVAVVSYCLTLMCRYGLLLQEESDMTL